GGGGLHSESAAAKIRSDDRRWQRKIGAGVVQFGILTKNDLAGKIAARQRPSEILSRDSIDGPAQVAGGGCGCDAGGRGCFSSCLSGLGEIEQRADLADT